MNHPVFASILFVFVAVGTAHSQPATESSQGIVSLFNGKNLDGWTTRQPTNHSWSVVDGVIDCNPQGDEKGGQNLWTAKEFGDFELWVDWRIKESPFMNPEAKIILPDGSYQKDDAGNLKTVTAPNTD